MAESPNELVERFRGYAHALAYEIAKTLPSQIDRNDLLAAADLGLVEAARAYDDSKGVQFQTFSYYRIRGAVYDCLRQTGWLSRSEYHHVKYQQATTEFLAINVSAKATHDQPEAALDATLSALSATFVVSLDASEMSKIPDPRTSNDAERSVAFRSCLARVRTLMSELSQDQRNLIEDFYYRNISLKEFAERHGHDKSWASRLHASTITQLSALLKAPAARLPR